MTLVNPEDILLVLNTYFNEFAPPPVQAAMTRLRNACKEEVVCPKCGTSYKSAKVKK